MFTLRHGHWSRTAELTGAANDGLGLSVALSAAGTTILAGAPFHNTSAGAAYVFTLRNGRWSQTGELTDAATGGDFGYSVALSALGATALVGASYSNNAAGAVYVFKEGRGAW